MSYDPIWSVLLLEGDAKYVVVGRESGAVEKFRLSDVKGKPVLAIKTAHKGAVTTLAVVPQGSDEIYSASLDTTICHWNLTTDDPDFDGKRLMKTRLATAGIRCGVVVNETLCCGGSDGRIHVLREEGVPERWTGHTDVVSCVSQCQTENGDGLLASGSYDGRIRVWNVATGACLFLLSGHTSQIKAVQFISGHMGVMGCGRDDTVRLWLLPEELDLEGTGAADEEGDDGSAEAEEGDEGEEGDATVSHRLGSHRGVPKDKVKRMDCVAVLGLPAAPVCAAAQPDSENPIVVVGLSGGAMATVKANKFFSAVSTYTKANAGEVRRERKRLDALLKAAERKELTQRKKALRKKKRDLIEEQKKEESDARTKEREEREAARQAERAARLDDDDEEDEEAPDEDEMEDEDAYGGEDEDEEGEEFALSEERRVALDTFKEEEKKASDERLRSLRASVAERRSILDPIGVKKFEREASQFSDLAFSRYSARAAADTISAVALNGTIAVAAVGNALQLIDGTPGVQSL